MDHEIHMQSRVCAFQGIMLFFFMFLKKDTPERDIIYYDRFVAVSVDILHAQSLM